MRLDPRHSLGRLNLFLFLLTFAFAPFTCALTTTSVALRANPKPAIPVILNAVVSPPAATGEVAFYDGANLLGVATLSSSSASFATSLLSAGAHSLQARCDGDPTHSSSLSPKLAETIDELPANGFQSSPASPYPLSGFRSSSPAIADFNGDGKLDLASSRTSVVENGITVRQSAILVFLGDDNGSFTALPPALTGYDVVVSAPVAGDFNGDGIPDLVFTVSTGIDPGFSNPWSLFVWLGDGKGGFNPAPGSPFPQGDSGSVEAVRQVAVADYNSDGNLDLTFFRLDGIHVWLGDGKGNFL